MAQMTIQGGRKFPASALKIPQIGLGVYKSPPDVTAHACLSALQSGYRHIDTAQAYRNELQVGQAIRQSGIPREEIFVTTKIVAPAGSVEKSYQAVLGSLEKLELDYVDLFLIHTPGSGPSGRKELWAALERLHKEGKAKSIGVSNYAAKHLEEMKTYAEVFPPAVNQIELHPWFQQKESVAWCREHGLVIEAYCPLVRQQKTDDPIVVKLAKKYSKNANQILVRWSIQQGFVPLPKSENSERIKANADVFDFEISKEDMQELDALDQGRAGGIAWQPMYCD